MREVKEAPIQVWEGREGFFDNAVFKLGAKKGAGGRASEGRWAGCRLERKGKISVEQERYMGIRLSQGLWTTIMDLGLYPHNNEKPLRDFKMDHHAQTCIKYVFSAREIYHSVGDELMGYFKKHCFISSSFGKRIHGL